MILTLLQYDPLLAIAYLAAILLALTVHEFSHGLVARSHGDRTAEREGRLTLNPLSHIDPIGFLSLLLLGFGWAKPVPYNPYNLRDPKWDSVKVALAGPLSNAILAAAAAFLLRTLGGNLSDGNLLSAFLFFLVIIDLGLAFFNLIPVHPLDGSKLLIALLDHPRHALLREQILRYGPTVLLALIVVSYVTPFDPFAFITGPTYAVCAFLLGGSCIPPGL